MINKAVEILDALKALFRKDKEIRNDPIMDSLLKRYDKTNLFMHMKNVGNSVYEVTQIYKVNLG